MKIAKPLRRVSGNPFGHAQAPEDQDPGILLHSLIAPSLDSWNLLPETGS